MSAHSRLERVEGQLAQADVNARREQLRLARDELRAFIDQTNCHPIMVRLAWHDSGTYDKRVQQWPQCGGANGSIRFEPELGHGANAGLVKAINYLKPLKQKYPLVSWADLIQLASAVSIELAGGPAIPMRYGRVDVAAPDQCPKEGNLPGAAPPFGDGAADAATHLRNVFHRMGFNDQEIVALSGAHTIGRAFKDRSGTVSEGPGAANGTRYTNGQAVARKDGKAGVGMPGGRSWTEKWLSFDNSYFQQAQRRSQEGLLWLPTDKALQDDPGFRPHFDRYAASQDAFFREYAAVHRKLSELGSKFDPAEGFTL